jgi:hypothetical protein
MARGIANHSTLDFGACRASLSVVVHAAGIELIKKKIAEEMVSWI